jgi:hypothetical protein
MPAIYEITFRPDGSATEFAGSRGNYYEFEDGSHLDMETTPVWCRRCERVTHGEEIETLEVMDQKIADLDDPKSELYKVIKTLATRHNGVDADEKFRLGQIENAKKRRQWREQRQAGPKCICCGSMDIFVFPINQEVPHPAGQGTVEVRWVGMCSTDFNQWFFTPEGDRIPRDTKPTRWHLPVLDKKPSNLQRFLRRIRGKTGPAAGEQEKS